jgi:hypothetical protein
MPALLARTLEGGQAKADPSVPRMTTLFASALRRLAPLALSSAATLSAIACGPVIAGSEPWTPPAYYAEEQFVDIDGLRICYL